LAIDEGPKNKVVLGGDEATLDRFQAHDPVLGHRFREGLRFPHQCFVAELPVRLGIEVSKAADLHGQSSVKQASVSGS
jgi:hypothetical protein